MQEGKKIAEENIQTKQVDSTKTSKNKFLPKRPQMS